MKKNYALLFAFMTTFGLSAQVSEINQQIQSAPVAKSTPVFSANRTASNPSTTPTAITTIWSDDFSTPANWTFTGGANEWDIVTGLSSNLTGQGFDTALFSTSGGNFAFIDSDANPSASQDAYIEYNNSIDCSAYPSVRLQYETYLRQYLEVREVLVSNDGGASWDTYTVLGQFGTNTNSPNPYLDIVDITPTAGGQSNVKIKFHYMGAWDWFWAIDDVAITSAPSYDVALDQEYYKSYVDSTYSTYYKMIPQRHADFDTITFGGAISNKGSEILENTTLSVNVDYNGSSVYTGTATPFNSAVGASDSVNVTTPFIPTNGLGMYNVTLSVAGDSTDENLGNNSITSYFEVSENEYRRDNDTVTSGNWYNVTAAWEMLSLFQINQTDTAAAVSVSFPILSNGRGVVEGDAISYYIYSDSDLENAITKVEYHTVTAAEEDGWITLPMPEATLTPGYYYVGFALYNDNGAVGSNGNLNANTAPLSVLVRTDVIAPSADQWSYTTSVNPFIRLYTKSADACAGVTINVTSTVVDNATLGSVDLTVSGGTPGYGFSWSGPNGFTSTDQNISSLSVQGDYMVTVTDVFGCSGTHTATVAGIVTVDEVSLDNNVKLFPNPNNGQFTLALNGLKGEYNVIVRNVLGQNVAAKRVNVNGSLNYDMNLSNLEKGVYFIEVSDNNQAKSVIRFMLK